MGKNNNQHSEWVPKGWEREMWLRVERIAGKMSAGELVSFYQETGAIQADNLMAWSKEDLLGVLDEIGRGNAEKLIEQYGE